MTAPDVNADVRARFEAAWKASRYGQVSFPNNAFKNVAEHFYRAAHADMAGEVRELPAYRYEAPSWQEIAAAGGDAMAALKVLHHAGSLINAQLPGTAQLCAKWPNLIGTIKAALAKHTHQEKP